ncbi:NAD-dependent deacetylase sirtuin-2 [Schizophyllum commune H4-8]|uniref:NAD-dependent deacetylase sirtuin-2 n=1 Tax=Schizophyllum commune (strain H4-8 / FGSC 9210) TaxID=578458 RepID=UPI00215ECC4A|nr:NAD-dependent deacetylase sirtuin-2 [Schizophyllum commune H4-8]KAI5896593.1 NAD-dependent deacetylase sirtuin-2 [Schizophyllum commune H4-8]
MNPSKSLRGIGVDRDDFKILPEPTMKGLAEYMKGKDCRKVVLMLGAGVSTAAGIPDFRSPKTGLYHNLARLNLPYPEAVFDMTFFRKNPEPFYSLAQELYPGKYKPTLTHAFINLLYKKNKLQMCFTQNIDTLERMAGVPEHKIIEAHGSFATQKCIECGKPFDGKLMKEYVHRGHVPRCLDCGGLVKPDIVFFGESLPPAFSKSVPMIPLADLLIIIGTSLTVHPFASLANMPGELCPRVLINMEQVGNIGRRKDDVVLLGECDKVVRDLCRELGWEDELIELWKAVQGEEEPANDKEAEKVGLEKAEAGRKHAEEEARRIAEKAAAVEEKRRAVGSTVTERISERQVKASQEDEVDNLAEAINKELHLGGEVASASLAATLAESEAADAALAPPQDEQFHITGIPRDDASEAGEEPSERMAEKPLDLEEVRKHEEDGDKALEQRL